MMTVQKPKVRSSFIVRNAKGLHTRPSTELVKCVALFDAEVVLIHHKMTVSAKSLLGILMLAATRGSKIWVEAEGADAEEAVATILDLAKEKFKMAY